MQIQKDEEAVRTVIAGLAEAWNMHDAKAFANLFSQDAEFTNVLGELARKPEGIEQMHIPPFTAIFKERLVKIVSQLITHQSVIKI